MTNKTDKELKKQIKNINRNNNKPHGQSAIVNSDNCIIDLFNVHKYYVSGKKPYHILKGVNLSIERGKFVVIYGQSGTGKSTLLNIISGLDRATEGDVIVNGVNLSSFKDGQLTKFRRDNIGFIFQSYNLLSDLNAQDNAKMGQVLQSDKSKVISIEKLFNDMDMGHLLKQDIRNLSGGQQQRVAIARALSKNPEIIFADEPTGSLDTLSSKQVVKLLKDINANYGTTIIVVTHDQSYKKIADHVLEVVDGQIKNTKFNTNQTSFDQEIIELPSNEEFINETIN